MTNHVFTIERLDEEGNLQSFEKTFRNRATADSVVAALNAGQAQEDSPVWAGNLLWKTHELIVEEDKVEEYLPVLCRYIILNPFTKEYEMSWLAENTADLASNPLPATEMHGTSDSNPYYKVYGRSIAEVEAVASKLVGELKAK